MIEPLSEPDVDPAREIGVIEMSEESFSDFFAALGVSAPPPEMLDVVRRSAPWEPGHTPRSSGDM